MSKQEWRDYYLPNDVRCKYEALKAELVEKDKRIKDVEQEIAEKIYKIGNQSTAIKTLEAQLGQASERERALQKQIEMLKMELAEEELEHERGAYTDAQGCKEE